MPCLLVRNPDDATPVRSVTNPIVIVFDPVAPVLDPELDEPGELDPPDELHAVKAVQATTTRIAHLVLARESRRRIGEPPLLSAVRSGTPLLSGRVLKRYRNPNGNVNEMALVVTEAMPSLARPGLIRAGDPAARAGHSASCLRRAAWAE